MALTPLDFPASPTVGQLYPDPPVTGQPTYRWDGAQWLSYAAASLPTPTKPANYGKKNYIINGAMMVSQENGINSGTVNAYYPVDQFSVQISGPAGAFGTSQIAVSPSPGGSPNRIRLVITTADASVGSNDFLWFQQVLEGLRVVDLGFGGAAAKTVTLQFGVRAPAGTYSVALRNNGGTRSYIADYVIAPGEANTEVIKSVVIPGDITGTWAKDNNVGIMVSWMLMGGSAIQTAAGVWTAGNFMCSPSQFNFMGTINNTFELFDVSLTEGSVAPPFQVPDYASELALCKRYYYKIRFAAGQIVTVLQATSTTSCNGPMVAFETEMRSDPTVGSFFGTDFTLQPAAGGANNVTTSAPSATRFRSHFATIAGSAAVLRAGDAVALYANNANAAFTFSARL